LRRSDAVVSGRSLPRRKATDVPENSPLWKKPGYVYIAGNDKHNLGYRREMRVYDGTGTRAARGQRQISESAQSYNIFCLIILAILAISLRNFATGCRGFVNILVLVL